MATTTTNFGWDIPQSTDLVKDGATAIAALGQDIDTALIDLKGGTTGQILSKASNTDLDYTWITNDVGDITAVTAGTGISGGGTSGSVTITNSMATAIDAKGDLVAGTGADAFSRLGVGANGTVLTADSAEATGLKWAAAAGGGGLTFIKSQTIGSAVSSVTVTGAFSATYDNYVISVTGGVGSSDGIAGLLTLGSTTTGYYLSGTYQNYTGGGATGFNVNNGSSWNSTYCSLKNHSGLITLQNPFLSDETTFQSNLIGTGTGDSQARYAGWLNNTTSYTAFTITTNTGTLTGGTIRVYGYQNS